MIFKNQIFTRGAEGKEYVRLGTLGEGPDRKAIVIDKHSKMAFPDVKPMGWLDSCKPLEQARLLVKLTIARDYATDASKKKADARWELIEGIVNNPALYYEGSRWDLVKAHAEEKGCAPNTILSALRLWWQGGQTKDALLGYLPAQKPAQAEAEEPASEAKPCMRGRPASKPGSINYRATRIDHENFKDVIKTFYLKDARCTAAAAYRELLFRDYSYLDGNGKRHQKPQGEYPSLKQFTTYLAKNYTTEHKLRSRKGSKAFERDHRRVFGTVDEVCRRPGEIYEFDSTIADATVVSSEGRADIIGRPTVFIIIDRKSRLVVGWYVGLEKPSWDAALLAIFSVAEDKRAMCHRLGLDYEADDWPAQGFLCEKLFVDRGESTSRRADSLAPLGVTITNLPSCRPDWKPLVEGQFKLTHQAISDLPGYNPSSMAMKRRSQNFSDGAALTLQEFEAIVVRWFIAHNRTIRKGHEFTRDQYRDRIEPSPVNLYAHGVRMHGGEMRHYSEAELKLALLPREDEATVDEHGIWVNKMCYQPANGEHPEWFVEGRRAVGAVRASYDRRRVDTILVHDRHAEDGFFVAKLARHSVKYEGLSLAEAQWMQKEEPQLLANAEHSKKQESVRFKDDTRPIVEAAKKDAVAATKGVSKSARRANTKEIRSRELDLERERSAVAAPAGNSAIPAAPSPAQTLAAEPRSNVIAYVRPQAPTKTLTAAQKQRAKLLEGTTF